MRLQLTCWSGGAGPQGSAALRSESIDNLLNDSSAHPGAGDKVSAVCAVDNQRGLAVEAVAAIPDTKAKNLVVADLPIKRAPARPAPFKAKRPRTER